MKLIDKIKTPDTLLAVVIFTILATAIHTFVVLYNSSQLNVWIKWMPALLFTGALALAVLIFTVHNNKSMTIVFAVIQGFLNALYYAFSIDWSENLVLPLSVASLVSISLPLAEYHYAKLLNEITATPSATITHQDIMDQLDLKYARKRTAKPRTPSVAEPVKESVPFKAFV